jgi:hypothetical protein
MNYYWKLDREKGTSEIISYELIPYAFLYVTDNILQYRIYWSRLIKPSNTANVMSTGIAFIRDVSSL